MGGPPRLLLPLEAGETSGPEPLTSRAGRRGERGAADAARPRRGAAQGGRQAGAAAAAASPDSGLRSACQRLTKWRPVS